jgi:hypothetical protein
MWSIWSLLAVVAVVAVAQMLAGQAAVQADYLLDLLELFLVQQLP